MKTLGIWKHVEVNVKGIKEIVDFEEMTIKELFDSFEALIGLRRFFFFIGSSRCQERRNIICE